jgi:hypothetical protein
VFERNVARPHGPPEERCGDEIEHHTQPELPGSLFESALGDKGQEEADGDS